jgi:streptogramin lyase
MPRKETMPVARPRRGRVDAEDRLWFAEYQGNAIGMFDPRTEKFAEWKLPTPWSSPSPGATAQRERLPSEKIVGRTDRPRKDIVRYPG